MCRIGSDLWRDTLQGSAAFRIRPRRSLGLRSQLVPRWTLRLVLLLAVESVAPAQTSLDPAEQFRRAQRAMEARDYEAAELAWKSVIALLPDLPEARSNLGLVFHLQRNYEDAIAQFQEALRQNPRLLAAKVFLGIDFYLTSRPDRAIQELEGARSLGPQDPMVCKWLAMSYVQVEDYESAIQQLTACRRLDPADLDLIFHLGRAYGKVSTLAFQAVRRAGLESPWLFLLRGQMFEKQGDARSALDEFRHAARLEPRMPGVHYAIGRVYEGDDHPREALSAFARELANHAAHLPAAAGLVRALESLGLPADANAVRDRALQFHQQSPIALSALAVPDSRLGRPPPSSADAAQIRESLPNFRERAEESWPARALAALLAGQPDQALQLASGRLDEESGEDARYWQARAYLALGQDSEALERLLVLHARRPGNAEFAFFLRTCAEKLALESLELFTAWEPDSYRTHQLRAQYHAARDDGNRAIEEYSRALALAPGATELHLAIGSIHMRARDYERALDAFRAELKNDPYSVAALSRTGEVYLLTGDIDEAAKVLSEAIVINPAAADPHKTLGKVYFRKREYQKSVERLQSALHLGIQADEDLHYHLGRAHQMLGNREEAEKHVAIVRRLKEARQSIAQERLEFAVGEPADSKLE